MDFSPILDAFGRVLGGSWGGFGEHFGVQDGSPKGKIVFFSKNVIFKGFWEGLGRVLGGSGEGFGRVLEGSGSFLGALGTSRRSCSSFLLFFRCLVAFLLFFCCFCLIFAYFACFLLLLLLAFAKLCWDEFHIFCLGVACFYYSQMSSLFPFLAKTGFFIGLLLAFFCSFFRVFFPRRF